MALGELKKLPVRDYFKHEAHTFTPWLACEENLMLLAETLGIELYDPKSEQPVGSFSADIVCQSQDGLVLIENQLELSDHRHLGQIITYAAGKDAKTIIWIFSSVREEHEAAIDWLNTISSDEHTFFALEIELWQIGESLPAPKFNIVAKPNGWARSERESVKKPQSLTETQMLQQSFWQGLNQVVREKSTHIRARTGGPQPWQNYSIGKTDFSLTSSMHISKSWIRVQFEMLNDRGKEQFDYFYEHKDMIETKISHELTWDKLEEYKASRICIYKSCDLNDRNSWSEYFDWIVRQLDQFYEVFQPLLKEVPV